MAKARNDADGDAIVFVVDADASSRASLRSLLAPAGWPTEELASPDAFLARSLAERAHCLVLDVTPPGTSAFALQARLGPTTPVVFVTATPDVPMSVRAMKAGAVDFLVKPLDGSALLASVELALATSRELLERRAAHEQLRARAATLGVREREVMDLVVAGLPNKQIADALAIAEATVKTHRGHVMHKMAAPSLPELVRIVERLRCEGGPWGR